MYVKHHMIMQKPQISSFSINPEVYSVISILGIFSDAMICPCLSSRVNTALMLLLNTLKLKSRQNTSLNLANFVKDERL